MKTLLLLIGLTLLGGIWSIYHPTEPNKAGQSSANVAATSAGDGQSFSQKSQSTLAFEANHGQIDQQVDYLARGNNYNLFLTRDGAVFSLSRPGRHKNNQTEFKGAAAARAARWPHRTPGPSVQLMMKLVGGNQDAQATGVNRLSSRSNYFVGNDSRQWRTNIPHYSRVKYRAVYPGVDLVYYGNQKQLEYDFVVAPGADPGRIKLAFTGSQSVSIDQNGELVLRAGKSEVRQPKPVVYQEVNGARREVAGGYVMHGEREVGFELGEYDHSRELVIDPVLIYSTFLGGSVDEYGNGVEADSAGNTYVTGITYSSDFLTKNPYQFQLRGVGNAFVSKFDPEGKLIYSTFLGGGGEDVGFAITADANGNAYVTGTTDSSDFPITAGSFQPNRKGNLETFVTKLNSTGSALVYSTFLGGAKDDFSGSIAIDTAGAVYLTGETLSGDFPISGAFQSNLKGASDVYVTKLNAAGNQLVYSTYLGGTGQDIGYGIIVDAAGSAYLTGFAYSSDYPTKNPAQANNNGRVDAFLTKMNPAGNALVYSTYLGGSLDDGGFGVGVDAAGNAYISGFTTSTNFPTKNPFQANNAGGDDAFVAKFDANGALSFSSYIGGSGEDRSFDLAADTSGNAYFIGRTESTNFPVKDAFQPMLNTGIVSPAALRGEEVRREPINDRRSRDAVAIREGAETSAARATSAVVRDGFVVKVNTAGAVVYSSFLGGSDEEKVFGVAVDNHGNCYVTGLTASYNFPTKNPVQRNLRGVVDAFVTKIADNASTQTSVSAASYLGPMLSPQQIVAAFGGGLSETTAYATTQPLPTTLDNISVQVIDSANVTRLAPLFFTSPTQINYVLPNGSAIGQARLNVIRSGVIVSSETLRIENLAPGIFSANASGAGVAAALTLRVKADGTQIYESVSRYDAGQNKLVAAPIDLTNLSPGEQVYLVLFGTGLRNRGSLSGVVVALGGTPVATLYAGPQGDFAGLDQINLGPLPVSLIGRGEINIAVAVETKGANTTSVSFK